MSDTGQASARRTLPVDVTFAMLYCPPPTAVFGSHAVFESTARALITPVPRGRKEFGFARP
jgi:hypothetical protein